MTFLEKLDMLMGRMGLNKHTLAERSGIPYSTIVNFYKLGYDNMKMSTLFKLGDFFNVPIDYLILDEFETPRDYYLYLSNNDMKMETEAEKHLISVFRSLNDKGKEAVLAHLEIVAGNPAMTSPPSTEKMAT